MVVSSSEPLVPISQLGDIKEVFFSRPTHGRSAALEVKWKGRSWKILRSFENPLDSDKKAREVMYQHIYEHLVKKELILTNKNLNQVSESNKPETNLVFNVADQTTSQVQINKSAASSSASTVTPDQLLVMAKRDIFSAESKLEQSRAELSSNINTLSEAQQTDASIKLAQLEEMIQYARVLKADKFKPEVIQKLIQYRLKIREAGISSDLPKRLATIDYFDQGPGKLWDDDGKLFGNMRDDAGIHSIRSKFSKFCNEHGGDYELITRWHKQQGKASWSDMSCQVKHHILKFREVDCSEYFTKPLSDPDPDPKLAKLEETLLMNMALIMEFLTHTELPGTDKVNKTITIFRSEAIEVIESANIPEEPSDKEKQFYMKRGPAEAGSIMASVLDTFRGITIQEVPFHRIISTYIMEPFLRDSGSDYEKEFICIFQGIPFKYLGIKGLHC